MEDNALTLVQIHCKHSMIYVNIYMYGEEEGEREMGHNRE